MTATSRRAQACALAMLVLLHAAHQRAGAQDARTLANRPGWLPPDPTMHGGIDGEGITPAIRAAATARLDRILRILLEVPEIARPEGFEIWPRYIGGTRIQRPDDTQHAGDVFAYEVSLMFAVPTWAIAGEGRDCIAVQINPRLGADGLGMRNAQGHAVYIEPARGPSIPPATQTHGRYRESQLDESGIDVLFTPAGELPWRHVTRDEFYDAVIFNYEGKDRSSLADVDRGLHKSPYDEWLAGAAQRKREREDLLKSLAEVQSPADLARTRQMLEDQEREVGENLRKSEAEDRDAQRKSLLLAATKSDSINAERNALSPAERRMPALIDELGDAGATGYALTDRDSPPEVRRALTPAYDFWRARRSIDEVRAIQVRLLATGTCSDPAVKRALWQFYQKLDWGALNRLVAEPRSAGGS